MAEISDNIGDSVGKPKEEELKKYYIVWVGLNPGIYLTWSDCSVQVHKFEGAKYKLFICKLSDAEQYFSDGHQKHLYSSTTKTSTNDTLSSKDIVSPKGYALNSIAVDAACSGNPGPVEYKGVDIESSKVIFEAGPFPEGTNNIGEFLAIVHALAFLKNQKSEKIIYSDSQTAIFWIKNKKCNTNLKQTSNNKKIFELISRAEKWLEENQYKNRILKWKTKQWSEIPADFNRKK